MGALLTSLAEAFDMDHDVAGRTLGERIEARLRRLQRRSTPNWGSSGDPAEVAREESRYLRFLYHPHLFPGMEPELRLAHELQFDLLPRALPDGFPLMVSAVLESYCHLSGDLLGWRRTASGDGQLWVVDVSGHGVRSGLASAVIKILLDEAPRQLGPAKLLSWLDRAFRACRNPGDRHSLYATGIVLEVDASGAGSYASAGHQPALARSADGTVSALPSTGPPLALLPDVTFSQEAVRLAPQDALLLYTDGVVETESVDGEPFGNERLEVLLRDQGRRLTELTRAVHRAVVEHNEDRQLDDDLTFVAVRPSAGPQRDARAGTPGPTLQNPGA